MADRESSSCTGLAVGQGGQGLGRGGEGLLGALPWDLRPGHLGGRALTASPLGRAGPLQGGGRGISERGISLGGLLAPEATSSSRPVPEFPHR